MIKPISIQNIQTFGNNISSKDIEQNNIQSNTTITNLPCYPISFGSAKISFRNYPKGSTPAVAKKLKALGGTLDEKLPKATEIILKDMGYPSNLVKCVDVDLKGAGYAAYGTPCGCVLFDKKMCQSQNSTFSDEAVMCILRHELDHMEVMAKLYKALGRDKFEELVNKNTFLTDLLPENMRKVDHEFYSEMSKYVDVSDFDAQKYVSAINNYYNASINSTSHYKNFTVITKNFDNELENSARDKQYVLEDLMGVTTLKDFYSMIDETKNLTKKIKAKSITDEDEIQKTFDDLYSKALESSGLEDNTQNWGKIIEKAQSLYN